MGLFTPVGVFSSARAQLDERAHLEVLAEPHLQRRLALADVGDASVLLRHRQVVAGDEDAARALAPQLPDPVDGGRAERRVVGRVALAREQFGAVLGRVAGEDRVVLLAFQDVDEMARGVARRGVGLEPRHELLLGRDRVQRRPVLELAHVQLGYRPLAPGLPQRPGELARADDDARVAEQDPVERVVVMRMGEDDVGDVLRLEAAFFQLREDRLPHAEAADVDQRDAPLAANERDGAPAQSPVAHHPPWKSLDEDLDLVAVDFHRVLAHSALMCASRISLPHFSESARTAAPNSSGVFPIAVAPIPESFSATAGSFTTLTTSSWIFAMIAGGTAAGATRPNQLVSS